MWWLLKEPFVIWSGVCLCSFSADSAGQLNVLGHDRDTLGVDGAQVGVFKKTNEVSFASFLKSHHTRALETQISLEILSDFSHKTLEGQLADQQLGGFLVTTNLTWRACFWLVRNQEIWLVRYEICELFLRYVIIFWSEITERSFENKLRTIHSLNFPCRITRMLNLFLAWFRNWLLDATELFPTVKLARAECRLIHVNTC